MKSASFLIVSAILVLTSCGRGESEPGAASLGKKPGAALEAKTDAPSTEKPVQKPKKDKAATISGKAVLDAEPDAGSAPEGKVSLTLGDGDELKGSLKFASNSLVLSGVKQGDNLRLWAAHNSENPDEVRRGYLFARAGKGGYEGVFAISGNGGKPAIKGKWSVE
ncbi:MAG: hypothetical protein GY847_40235 [Proteobacteria bacterium]|nr:hypothetical protein [Pseudomonadota bacterium]